MFLLTTNYSGCQVYQVNSFACLGLWKLSAETNKRKCTRIYLHVFSNNKLQCVSGDVIVDKHTIQ